MRVLVIGGGGREKPPRLSWHPRGGQSRQPGQAAGRGQACDRAGRAQCTAMKTNLTRRRCNVPRLIVRRFFR